MRFPSPVALVVFIVGAGCVAVDDDVASPTSPTPTPDLGPLPKAFKDTKSVQAGADPFDQVDGKPCTTQASSCYRYPFEVGANATNVTMWANLTFTNSQNDFDLYLYRGPTEVTSSTDPSGTTTESIKQDVLSGAYEVWVVAWAAVQDSYTLDVTFAHY